MERSFGQHHYLLSKKSSLSAAATFDADSIDYVFLDAAHDYESVRADIAAWWPKIKPGGWFAGHDYTHAEGSLVRSFLGMGDAAVLVNPPVWV